MKTASKIEVLCPAGDFESVKASVQNGADAVYLGYQLFSARQNAKNFDENDLREAVTYCHARGVLVYLAVNTLVFDNQLDDVVSTIQMACSLGIDALIVQDLAVFRLIRDICKTMPIHASTQMAVHSKKGAALLAELGFRRVVLARECTLSEISDIAKNVAIETEVFVHGALCMSVSGQCYISAMIGTRSGNRGNCAGTCRLPFSSTKEQSYDLSLKDNCLAFHVDDLIKAGVTSLKIEGRMKRPEYVAAAAHAYDIARKGETPDINQLQAVFSRNGFTDGYLTNKVDATMFGYRQKEDVISATSKVLKSLSNTYQKENPRIKLDFHIKIEQNEAVTLTATDQNGNSVAVQGNKPELAINAPTTQESVSRSLTKLGSTPFYLGSVVCEIGEGLVVSMAELNELRRTACEKLLKMRGEIKPLPYQEIAISLPHESKATRPLSLRARFMRFSQIPFSMINSLGFIILPIDEIIANQDELELYKNRIIIELDRVLFLTEQSQTQKLTELSKAGYQHILADNLAHIQLANELGLVIHAGNYLNCINSLSAKELCNMGAVDITLSFEAELSKTNKIKATCPIGLIVYGSLPLMIMKNCPIKAKITCKQCQGNHALIDRTGTSFPVVCNNQKYSEVLNSTKLYMADRLDECKGMQFATLYFTTEQQDEIMQVIEQYQQKSPATGSFTRGLYYRSI